MVKFDFNPSDYENDGEGGGLSRDPVPPGVYALALIDADTKEASTGKGVVMTCKYEVVEGEFKGKWLWERFNIIHSNPTAERIARGRIDKWAKAAGRPGVTDTDKLVGRKFFAKVGVEEGSGGYGPRNNIEGFVVSSSEAPKSEPKVAPKAEPKVAPKAEPVKAATGGQKRPWE